jgi:hypothetical protein
MKILDPSESDVILRAAVGDIDSNFYKFANEKVDLIPRTIYADLVKILGGNIGVPEAQQIVLTAAKAAEARETQRKQAEATAQKLHAEAQQREAALLAEQKRAEEARQKSLSPKELLAEISAKRKKYENSLNEEFKSEISSVNTRREFKTTRNGKDLFRVLLSRWHEDSQIPFDEKWDETIEARNKTRKLEDKKLAAQKFKERLEERAARDEHYRQENVRILASKRTYLEALKAMEVKLSTSGSTDEATQITLDIVRRRIFDLDFAINPVTPGFFNQARDLFIGNDELDVCVGNTYSKQTR